MFDKFGEFDSAVELNMAAAGQKEEGDETAFYALAEENGIEKEDAEDYWNGDTDRLATITMAAFGRLEVLEQEEINTKKNQVEKIPLQVILTMLKSMCTDEAIAKAVMQKGKRLSDIFNALKNEAGKHKIGNMGVSCGTDRELRNIIRAYYLESESALKKTISDLYKEG